MLAWIEPEFANKDVIDYGDILYMRSDLSSLKNIRSSVACSTEICAKLCSLDKKAERNVSELLAESHK